MNEMTKYKAVKAMCWIVIIAVLGSITISLISEANTGNDYDNSLERQREAVNDLNNSNFMKRGKDSIKGTIEIEGEINITPNTGD